MEEAGQGDFSGWNKTKYLDTVPAFAKRGEGYIMKSPHKDLMPITLVLPVKKMVGPIHPSKLILKDEGTLKRGPYR